MIQGSGLERETIVANLQVKGMDDNLYRALGARAKRNNRSISQEVVTLIQEGLSRPEEDPAKATRELLKLAGTWKDSRSAEEIADSIRKARRFSSRREKMLRVFD